MKTWKQVLRVRNKRKNEKGRIDSGNIERRKINGKQGGSCGDYISNLTGVKWYVRRKTKFIFYGSIIKKKKTK